MGWKGLGDDKGIGIEDAFVSRVIGRDWDDKVLGGVLKGEGKRYKKEERERVTDLEVRQEDLNMER